MEERNAGGVEMIEQLGNVVLSWSDKPPEITSSKGQFDGLFNPNSFLNCSWKVYFSADFRKSFAKINSLKTKKKVLQTMLKLANGWRSKRNTVVSADSFNLAKIYPVRDVTEQFLVWTVDIMMDERYIQVIKVWEILPLSQLTRFTDRLDHLFSMYTDSYKRRCKAKCTDGNIEQPLSWDGSEDILRYKLNYKQEQGEIAKFHQNDVGNVLENSKVCESLILMKFYALTSGIVSHLLTANDGTELSIPFQLSEEEELVVRFSKSCFIIGRSGTGKTTILTTKLVQRQQQYHLALQGVCGPEGDLTESSLRQVFITVSLKLCLAIKDHITRLSSFAATGRLYCPPRANEMHDDSDKLSPFVDIPDAFQDLPNKHYPLVITFEKFLMMLDGSMGFSFFDRFCNFRGFSSNKSASSKSLWLQLFLQKEVSYEKFVGSYWPHFSTTLTKKLDASIVYTEIISHIKGDFEAGSFFDGKLGRSDYIMLAKKRVSPFSEEIRENIYDIFLEYEKKKCLKGEFDISDYVMDLHQRLRCNAFLGDKFDFVYVDEVQDLTLKQVALLKYICTNYEEGFLFAGDAAQTIAKGIDFRFEDIRCLFYKEFISELRKKDQFKKDRKLVKKNFHLKENYRTHSGVLKLAKSIMDLLHYFFPLNIDRIAPETSLICGDSPVLLESKNDENVIITLFRNATGECSKIIEFGAEQVILVRDDCEKKQIVELVGNKALVLTIIECKGLEFQDVFLYNFFGGSPLTLKWRVVYEYMNKNGFFDQNGIMPYPNFDIGKHNLLCSELKQLYVAITRTRQRLWICESSNDYCKPIFDYWKSLCLVQVTGVDSSFVQAMQVVSTKDDWKIRGIKLFNEKNYDMAMMCFERAGDTYKEKWARAAGLVCNAERVISSKPEMAEAFLKKAANIYEAIEKAESAATCYIKLKDFTRAGRLYLEKCGESSIQVAADCFYMAKEWSMAADTYAKAKCFYKCLSICHEGRLYYAVLSFINQWKEDPDFNKLEQHELYKVKESFLNICVMLYAKLGDIKNKVELAKVLLSLDLIQNFLKLGYFFDEPLQLEKLIGSYLEAADIAHLKGNILLEADMLQMAKYYKKSVGLILRYVILKSLWASGSKGWPFKEFAEKKKLLCQVELFAKQVSDSFYDNVSSEAYIISNSSKDLFNLSKHLVKANKYQNIRLQIFTLREIIDIHLKVEPCNYIWEPGFALDIEKHANPLMSQNICSVESLMHGWELWKNKILKVLYYLSFTTRSKENEFELYEQFCLDYLGVLVKSDQKIFLLDPKAAWTKTSHKLGNISIMDSELYKESAQHHWRRELYSIGLEIMKKLESLISFSKRHAETCSRNEINSNNFERKVLFPFSKARVIFAIDDVVKFLIKSDTKFLESIDLESIAKIKKNSTSYFFSILFTVRWREGSNLSMLNFHKSVNAMEIIEEFVDRDLKSYESKFTLGKMGRVVMLLFLAGEDKLCSKMFHQLICISPWKDLIIILRDFLNGKSQKISLILKLEQALKNVFHTDWKEKCDFMSPHCFMYLLDCLLFCASTCRKSGFPFFITKTILFDILQSHGLKGFLDTCFVAPFDSQASVQQCLVSIFEMITMLLRNKSEIKEWCLQSSMNHFDYCDLIRRMVITLCLTNLNSGKGFNIRKFLLQNYILDDLHEKFRDAIAGCCDVRKNLSDFSNALIMDQDSLVCVVFKDNKFVFSKLNAIYLKPVELSCSEDVIAKHFPKTSSNKSKNCLQLCIYLCTLLKSCDKIKLDDIIYYLSTLIALISQDIQQKDSAAHIQDIRKIVREIKFHSSFILLEYHSIRRLFVDGGIEPPCTIVELERRCPGLKSNLITFIGSLLEKLEYYLENLAREIIDSLFDGMIYSYESFLEVVEDGCKEKIAD